MSVYDWIRDGVRQAVLGGFEDAVEQIGVPEQGRTVSQHLLNVLKPVPARGIAQQSSPTATIAPAAAQPASRKRLGRTLDSRKSVEDVE